MRVCVFGLRGFPEIQGGVEKHCEALYSHFVEIDLDFVIFRRKPYVKDTPNYDNIRFIDLPSTKVKGIEPVFHSLLATIWSICLKPDIVHIHNIGPALFCPLLKLFGRTIVVTYHSPNYEHEKWSFIARKILKFSEVLMLMFADEVIFVNRFQMKKMPQKYQSKLVYIPNGIEEGLNLAEASDCIEKYGLEKEKYILALGRITYEKGFDILIDAFKRADTADIKLCIAGGVETEKKYFEELKAAANTNVVFPGFVSGELLRQLYSHARLFVLPSRNEGFPLALLDAMAYKRNILVSDIPATNLVKLPERHYFETSNVEQLSLLITERLKEKYQLYHYDLSDFDWSRISKETMEVYLKGLF